MVFSLAVISQFPDSPGVSQSGLPSQGCTGGGPSEHSPDPVSVTPFCVSRQQSLNECHWMNEPTGSVCYLTLGLESNLYTGQKKFMSFAPNQWFYFNRPYICRKINYLLTLCPQKADEPHELGLRGKAMGQKSYLVKEHWCKAARITATSVALANLSNARGFAHREIRVLLLLLSITIILFLSGDL